MPPAPFTITAFGAPWRLVLDEENDQTYERMRALWARCTITDDPSVPTFRVWREQPLAPDEQGLQAPADDEELPYALSRAITMASITVQTGTLLMLHAAGLADRDGERFVALVAPSGTGKSTATRTLGPHFGYLSDETIALTPELIGVPYPKPISTIRPGGHAGDKEELGADEAGLGPTPSAARLVATVLLDRDPAAGPPTLEHVPLLPGILAMIEQSSAIPMLPDPLDWLARAASAGRGPYRLRYAEIGECAGVIEDLLLGETATASTPVTPWTTHPAPAGRRRDPEDTPGPRNPEEVAAVGLDDHVQRAPWTDAISVPGQVLVLLGALPMHLQGIGEFVWSALAEQEPRRLGDLVAPMVAAFGPHPQADDLIIDGLRQLVAAAVVEVVSADG